MSTTAASRPSSTRKTTRKTEEKAQDAFDTGIRVTLDGKTYEARIGDVTPQVAREIRSRTGHSFRWLMGALFTDPDIDLVAEFVWAARLIDGDRVDLDDIQVSYADLLSGGVDIEQVGGAERGDDGPEA